MCVTTNNKFSDTDGVSCGSQSSQTKEASYARTKIGVKKKKRKCSALKVWFLLTIRVCVCSSVVGYVKRKKKGNQTNAHVPHCVCYEPAVVVASRRPPSLAFDCDAAGLSPLTSPARSLRGVYFTFLFLFFYFSLQLRFSSGVSTCSIGFSNA